MKYFVEAAGMCLPGIIENHEVAVIDPDAPIAPLDVVAIVLDDFALQMIKVFLGIRTLPGDGGKAYAFGLLDPLAILVFPESRIDVLHRVASIIGDHGAERPATPLLRSSWLGYSAGFDTIPPINPGWRPPEGLERGGVNQNAD